MAFITAFGLLGLVSAPAWADADLDQSISDDGQVVRQTAAAGSASPSFSGTGRVLAPAATDDALANFPAGDTAADIARLRRAKPRSTLGGTGSVIGIDQRVRVTPTTTFPARATAWILFSDGQGGDYVCSGWFINKNTIAAAGHCVADGGSGRFFPHASYKIYPGRNGGSSPYGSCTAKRLSTVAGWLNAGKDDYDYAAIKLNCDIGNTVGWYGYTVLSSPNNTPITVQGYPGDKPLGTQWRAADKIRASDVRRLFYQADTFGGQSGAPVWYKQPTLTCSICVIAVHAYGVYGNPPFRTNNHGTRITSTVASNLTHWKNAP